jgi:L-seryl-tRNA(Ser) seleniumtransferase
VARNGGDVDHPVSADPRRSLPRTDVILGDARLRAATGRLGTAVVKNAVVTALAEARSGTLPIDGIADRAHDLLPALATEMRAVINATGVVLHTNLGRAPLSAAAVEAMVAAAGYVDVEFDLADGSRARRGRGVLSALRAAVPGAEQALAVNNGAAALLLAVTTLASGREVVISRGEMVEIGDNFRLPDLMTVTGAMIREVGTTNRTSLSDYARAVGPETGCVVKIHPSNFLITGFTSSVGVAELATLGVPVIADVGSGLLVPDQMLPDEPDVAGSLGAGADVVTCSGDKLLGGPQTGLIFGRADLVERMRAHPLARALRCDKLTLAALEATLRGPRTPTSESLHADPQRLRQRCDLLAAALGAQVVPSQGTVGGGGAPGVPLPGWAVALDSALAAALRTGPTPVVGRVSGGHLLLDLRCVPPADDERLREAVLLALGPPAAQRIP